MSKSRTSTSESTSPNPNGPPDATAEMPVLGALTRPSSAPDIPGFEGLPVDVRERLLRARRDPTSAATLRISRQAQVIQVGTPAPDDIFRCHPDKAAGQLDVHLVQVKKGFSKAGSRRTYLVGPKALTNPAVAERARAGVAVLTLTAEGTPGVWVVAVPDMVEAGSSYPFDVIKWQCVEAARSDWVTFCWNKELGVHQWQLVDLAGQPNEVPVWPAEHPLISLDRAIGAVFVDDPDYPEFKNLVVRKASP